MVQNKGATTVLKLGGPSEGASRGAEGESRGAEGKEGVGREEGVSPFPLNSYSVLHQ